MRGAPRGVRPTDLLALVSFDGRVFRNEAVTWDRLSRAHEPPSVVESALESMLSFATGRHTWISVKGQRIRALVTGRRRGGPSAWEVDTLLATDEEPSVAPGLLEQLAKAARKSKAHRVFLRLADDSPALDQALAAGFAPYRTERTFVSGAGGFAGPPEPPPGLRPRQERDTPALFRLYCETTPESIRAQEAAVPQQWAALRERDGTRAHQELVLEERDGRISAWVRVARDGRALRLMPLLLHPDRTGDAAALLGASLLALSGRRAEGPVIALTPEHVAVGPALEALGFAEGQNYVMMVRKLVAEVELRQRRPAFARGRGVAVARSPLSTATTIGAPP